MTTAAAKRISLTEIDRRANIKAEAQARARAEQADIEAHRLELVSQGDLRGAEYHAPAQKRGERRKPIRRLTGLEWLKAKKRLTEDQHAAGLRYGAAYRRFMLEPPLRSILNRDLSAGDGLTLAKLQHHAMGTENARHKLAMYRGQLMGNSSLISACDLICGLEKTPRESAQNGRDAERTETLLLVALDLMALHLGPSRVSEAAKPQDVD